MEVHTSNSVSYFLSIGVEHKDFLGAIRHWSNLKIAFEDGLIWIKDFNSVQIDSLELKTIPYKHLYYSSGPKLFLLGSQLPERNLPSLLWSPVERGLDIQLPVFNHNYFGLNEKMNLRLLPSENEQASGALLVKKDLLKNYLDTAPAVRLKGLTWLILNETNAMILGTPLLPLSGETFCIQKDFLMPAGYTLEYYLLSDKINDLINPENEFWIMWYKDGSYVKLKKNLFRPLTISSCRLSFNSK